MCPNPRTMGWVLILVAGCACAACGDDSTSVGNNNNNGNDNQNVTLCGDGVPEGTEECDDGEQNSDSVPDACRTDCTSHRCGDRVVDTGEECDEGEQNSDSVPDSCRADCTPPRCGDGVVDAVHGETCDCGDDVALRPSRCTHVNGDPDGSCAANCVPLYCGNGIVETDQGEECDDSNNLAGDGCGPLCLVERCGNGFMDPGEGCDLGDEDNSDEPDAACRTNCQVRTCGDGIVDVQSGEACDGDATAIDVTCAELGYYHGEPTCSALCRVDAAGCTGSCGDGVADLGDGETCDGTDFAGLSCLSYGYYGGALSCQSNCQVALGACEGRCGDGTKNGSELCDGADFGDLSCVDYGYYTGSLSCSSDCQTVTPICEQYCGDGEVNGLEQCDGEDLDNAYCADFVGYDAGRLNCNAVCERKLGYCFSPGWRTQLTDTSELLRGVWGSAEDNVYAVGHAGVILHNRGGASWNLVSSGTTENLFGVWGNAADDVYVVGAAGTVLHFDGSAWQPMSVPTTNDLHGVWYASPTDVWVVGDGGTVLRYNGTAWSSVSLGTSQNLTAIWGSGPSNVFVIGDQGLTRRFNGTGWDNMDDTSTSPQLRDISGVDQSHVWVAGSMNGVEYIRFFNGTSWTAQIASGMGAANWTGMRAIWAASPSLAFAGGWDGGGSGYYRRFNGTSWVRENGLTTNQPFDMWGTSPTNIYVVGEQGFVHRFGGDGEGWVNDWVPASVGRDVVMLSDTLAYAMSGDSVLRWDGTTWSTDFTLVGASAPSLWASSPSNIYALFHSGGSRIYHYNGTSWSQMVGAPVTDNPYKLFGLPTGELFLLGDFGRGYTFNGTSWSSWNVGGDCWIGISLWASSPSDIWVVGRRCIEHYNGTSWTKHYHPPSFLMHVTGRAWNDVWAFGLDGLALHYDGQAWTRVLLPSGEDLWGGWVTPEGEAFAAGFTGTVLWFDGGGWSPMATHTRANLKAIHGASRNHMLAVGEEFLEFIGELPRVPYCGNGTLEPESGEECDDGNNTPGDGCEADCRLVCGGGSGAQRAAFDPVEGYCIAAFHTTASWTAAEAHCQSLGGHLGTVGSAEENDTYASLAGGDAWIGFTDLTVEGTFAWQNGETVAYTNWGPGEPNNMGAEDCAEIYHASGMWNDRACSNMRRYVCELMQCGDGSIQLANGEECDDGNLVAGDGCAPNCTCEGDCQQGSCAAILAAGLSHGDGVYLIDPAGIGRPVPVYCDMTSQDGGWTLVRRTHAGSSVHFPLNDNVAGTAAFSTYLPDPQAEATFSLAFDELTYTEMRFSTGDGQFWLSANRDQVQQGYVSGNCGQAVTVNASHLSPVPHQVQWCKRTTAIEDPWISAEDHLSAGESESHSMLYGEAGSSDWSLYRTTHGGLNLLVR